VIGRPPCRGEGDLGVLEEDAPQDDEADEEDHDEADELDRRQRAERMERAIGSLADRPEEVRVLGHGMGAATRNLARRAMADPVAVLDHARIIARATRPDQGNAAVHA
jgi:hypothetical protein